MSVELQKLRGELLREGLLRGWTRPSDVPSPWTTQLEPGRIEKWYKRLYSTANEPLPVGNRLVNHFSLGADPEFVFHNGVERIDARTLGLKAGPAFGADNNSRLCELRPHPSRSALSVLASMWLAMRWMAVFHPDVLKYSWRSGAYFEGDGLGGHVHFGRKRLKLREREVGVLDRLTHLLFVAGIFDREEGRLRVRQAQGAPQGQPYGALSDIRHQPHGYEYRTLPSWIDNPWLAYFSLVVSKLAVAFPDLVAPLTEADALTNTEQARSQLRMLLAYYGPLDDDARLAASILARQGFPVHAHGLDFKANWGLFAGGPLGSKPEAPAPGVYPETIQASSFDEKELGLAMFEGRSPELTALTPNWKPSSLPPGFFHAIKTVDTKVAPGLGEFAMGLAMHKDCQVALHNCGHRPYAFRFPNHLQSRIQKWGLFSRLGVPADCQSEDWTIYVNASKDYTQEQLNYARQVIVESQIFPIWNLADVRPDSYKKWLEVYNRTPKEGNKVVFEANGQ